MSITRQRAEMIRGKTVQTNMFSKQNAVDIIVSDVKSPIMYKENIFTETMLPSDTTFFNKSVDSSLVVTYNFSPYSDTSDAYILRRYHFVMKVKITIDGEKWINGPNRYVSYSDHGSQVKTYFNEHFLFSSDTVKKANKFRINISVFPKMGDSGADYAVGTGDDYPRTLYMPYVDDFSTPSNYPAGHSLTYNNYINETPFILSCTVIEVYDL